MYKLLYNQGKIIVNISPITPLLIKSGMESADPSLPDMSFVRTENAIHGETVYIPGSSLKGVIRSYCEKILRTLGIPCCNPMSKNPWDDKSSGSCSYRKAPHNTDPGAGPQLYKDHSCYACRTFGSTHIAGRVGCVDGFLRDGCKTEKRSGVAIDRVIGSVAVGPFDYEVVTSGTFKCEIFLTNFQLWQIGLIGLALRDLDEGYVQLGFAKSRGLGRVAAKVQSIEINYIKKPIAEGQIWGIGMDENLRNTYGLIENDYVVVKLPAGVDSFRPTYGWQDNTVFKTIVAADSPCWQAFLALGEQ